ncbi:MAG: hypothetical protein VX694_08155 [Planctomycetota bacterium]|nr:hypothetical protein [Planctomycetota bacterium]
MTAKQNGLRGGPQKTRTSPRGKIDHKAELDRENPEDSNRSGRNHQAAKRLFIVTVAS